MVENYLQHAEHYQRIINSFSDGQQSTSQQAGQQSGQQAGAQQNGHQNSGQQNGGSQNGNSGYDSDHGEDESGGQGNADDHRQSARSRNGQDDRRPRNDRGRQEGNRRPGQQDRPNQDRPNQDRSGQERSGQEWANGGDARTGEQGRPHQAGAGDRTDRNGRISDQEMTDGRGSAHDDDGREPYGDYSQKQGDQNDGLQRTVGKGADRRRPARRRADADSDNQATGLFDDPRDSNDDEAFASDLGSETEGQPSASRSAAVRRRAPVKSDREDVTGDQPAADTVASAGKGDDEAERTTGESTGEAAPPRKRASRAKTTKAPSARGKKATDSGDVSGESAATPIASEGGSTPADTAAAPTDNGAADQEAPKKRARRTTTASTRTRKTKSASSDGEDGNTAGDLGL